MLPRHSELIRPAVANVDQALVIFAITKPQPNFNLLDRFLVMMQQQDIPCIICLTSRILTRKAKRKIIVPFTNRRDSVRSRSAQPDKKG